MKDQSDQSRFWRRNARRYDRGILLFNRRFPQMVAMTADDVRGCNSVLEVGAGTGLVTVALASVVPTLTATDASPDMLEILRGRLAYAGHGRVRTAVADVCSLDFPDRSFDGVVAANLLHLLPDIPRALAEISRVLLPNGLLCVPTFAHGENLLAHTASRLLGLVGFPVVTRFWSRTLRAAVEESGFAVVREATIPGILPVAYISARRAQG